MIGWWIETTVMKVLLLDWLWSSSPVAEDKDSLERCPEPLALRILINGWYPPGAMSVPVPHQFRA